MPTFRRKQGHGPHYLRVNGARVVVRAGQTVVCEGYELGAFQASYDCLDPVVVVERVVKIPMIKRRGNTAFYDVVNPDNPDKPLNDKALFLKAAEAFLSDLLPQRPETSNDPAEG